MYGSNSEIIREGLRSMIEPRAATRTARTAIAEGLADAEKGRIQGIDEVRAELHRHFVVDSKGSPA